MQGQLQGYPRRLDPAGSLARWTDGAVWHRFGGCKGDWWVWCVVGRVAPHFGGGYCRDFGRGVKEGLGRKPFPLSCILGGCSPLLCLWWSRSFRELNSN